MDKDKQRVLLALRWFGAEFLVVVTGVLMAFAISAGYENYQNRQKEEQYLKQLIADLIETENSIIEENSSVLENNRARGELLKLFYKSTSVNKENFFRLWMQSTRKVHLYIVDSTAQALVSTGDIKLITNKEIKSSIVKWLSYTHALQTRYEDYELLFRQYGFDAAKLIDIGDVVALAKKEGASAAWSTIPEDAEQGPFGTDMEAVLNDRNTFFHFNNQNQIARNLHRWQLEAVEETKSLRLIIENYMQTRSN